MQTGFKLFRKRKNKTYGPLFINKRLQLEVGKEYQEENHPTKGFAIRPGWHVCSAAIAPHLSTKDRVWCQVEFEHKETIKRPDNQGGIWYLGSKMKIVKEVDAGTKV